MIWFKVWKVRFVLLWDYVSHRGRWYDAEEEEDEEEEEVRAGGTERKFERQPVHRAERGAVAATKHLSVRESERITIAVAKRLEQLAKCKAKLSS